MAAIVLIHGINNQRFGPHTLKSKWLGPLRDGILLGCGRSAALPAEVDVDIAFWGDLFRAKAQTLSLGPPPLQAKDLNDAEQALLRLMVEAAERSGAVPRAQAGTLAAAPGWLHAAINKLAKSAFFRELYGDGAIAKRWLIYGLKTVHAYMHSAAVYEAVQNRVDEAIGADTRVVIGHSLGSVIAYEALCRAPRQVTTLITLGSPLGVPTLIYDRLRPEHGWLPASSGEVRVRVRPQVAHWYNVWDDGDLIALTKPLAPKFEPPMRELKVSTGSQQPHAIEKYLTDAAVGCAIVEGWQ